MIPKPTWPPSDDVTFPVLDLLRLALRNSTVNSLGIRHTPLPIPKSWPTFKTSLAHSQNWLGPLTKFGWRIPKKFSLPNSKLELTYIETDLGPLPKLTWPTLKICFAQFEHMTKWKVSRGIVRVLSHSKHITRQVPLKFLWKQLEMFLLQKTLPVAPAVRQHKLLNFL